MGYTKWGSYNGSKSRGGFRINTRSRRGEKERKIWGFVYLSLQDGADD